MTDGIAEGAKKDLVQMLNTAGVPFGEAIAAKIDRLIDAKLKAHGNTVSCENPVNSETTREYLERNHVLKPLG